MKTTHRPVRRPRTSAERLVLILLGVLAGARCSVETAEIRVGLGADSPTVPWRAAGAR